MPSVPQPPDSERNRILILDFGSQFTQLIARRIREQKVYCEIHPAGMKLEAVRDWDPAGIVLSGGPSSVLDAGAPDLDLGLLELGRPVLGVCYGMQLLIHRLGGVVERSEDREYGRALLKVESEDPLLADLPGGVERVVWMSHGDRVLRLPPGFAVLGTSESSPYAAVRHLERPIWGLLFHPEVAHTDGGDQILANFVSRICGCDASWTMDAFIDRTVGAVRKQVGSGRVICGLSGGVDSSVAAALVHRAVGDQLHCIFVDNGLLRRGEREEVERSFREGLGIPLVTVSAQDREVQKFKPSPRGLEVTIQRLGVEKHQVLYIGDRPEIDAAAASGTGIACVIIGRQNVVDRRGWVEVSGYRELKEAICCE